MNQYSQLIKQGGFEELDVSVWACSGEKAAVFLHGQLTNHIKGLKDGEGNYNLLLTIRGKIVGDLYVYRNGNLYYLVIDKNQTKKIIEPLKKLSPLSRVTLIDESQKFNVVHVYDPVGAAPCGRPEKGNHGGLPLHFSINRLGLPGWDVFVPSDEKIGARHAVPLQLENQGLVRIDSDLHEVIRVEQGVARYGIDFDEENLPQEARLERAMHFDKGCYLGQEIIARLHFRGHVNKILAGLKIDTVGALCFVPLPMPGTKIYDGEKEVGKITSCIWSPKLNAPLALGYLPYLSDRSNKSYQTCEKTRVETILLPLKS